MSPPSFRFSPARSAVLAVSALVLIGLPILSPALFAAEAAYSSTPIPSTASFRLASPSTASSFTATTDHGQTYSGTGTGTGTKIRTGSGASPAWVWPVGPGHVILRPFTAPATTYSAGHRGIDIESAEGTPVVAVDAGVVHFAGTVVDRSLVSIRHAGGVISSVEPVVPSVAEGQVVAAGETIGTVAAAHCARACVHLGVRLHGEYVSPLRYLGGLSPSVLLPTRHAEG